MNLKVCYQLDLALPLIFWEQKVMATIQRLSSAQNDVRQRVQAKNIHTATFDMNAKPSYCMTSDQTVTKPVPYNTIDLSRFADTAFLHCSRILFFLCSSDSKFIFCTNFVNIPFCLSQRPWKFCNSFNAVFGDHISQKTEHFC